ncbi:MAG: hypothetical protein AABZ30_16130, partial [Myxococcota bacterium]
RPLPNMGHRRGLAAHLLAELAARLRAGGALLGALDAAIACVGDVRAALDAIVRERPSDLDARRALARFLELHGDARRAWAHYGIVAFADADDPAADRYVEVGAPGDPPPGVVEALAGPLAPILGPLTPLLEGFLASLQAYDGITPLEIDVVARARARIGGPYVHVLRMPVGGAEVTVENSVPPCVLVGNAALSLPASEQVFLIVRALHSLRGGGAVLRKLDASEAVALFRTLAAMLSGEPPPAGPLTEALRALPFRADLMDVASRRLIAAELRHLADAGVETAMRAAEQASCRVALLLCRDVAGALRALARVEAWAEPPESAEARAALLVSSRTLADLATFAVDEAPSLWRS